MYPHQLERLTEALARERLGAVVATSAANVFYLTGFESPGQDTSGSEHFAVWTPSGEALTAPPKDAARVSSALRDLGLTRGRIGLDESSLTQAAWKRLTAALAGFTVVPGAAALAAARRVKSPYEIECLGRALGIAEEALNAVLQTLEPGVSERQAAAAYQREVIQRDAAPSRACVAFGERTWITRARPGDRALKPGDLVRLDVGAVFRGYWASVARTAVMGEPTERQASVFDAVQSGLEAGIDAVKPGVAAAAVCDVAHSRVRERGLPAVELASVGHGIGLEPHEDPHLRAGVATPLESGEVLCVEVPYLEDGWGGVVLRDTVLVTTSGARAVNRSVHGLVVLD